ncbi:MAG: hypothetical protein QOJ64_387 [Acidobacteriota bacterium]|nr:hypothetical protein [Acidobacteriota bacterium]
MVKLMNSIVGRVYSYVDSHIHAHRYDMRLPMSVSLLESRRVAKRVPSPSDMSGYLRDISKTGLSLVVPSLRFGNRFLVSGHYPLRVMVELPNGTVDIQVAPVRYDKLHEKSDRKYLIGARIMQMTDSDRRHLSQYIQEVKKSKPVSFSFARETK